MSMSSSGQDLVKKFEGFACCVYNDSSHNATIGYGHNLHSGEATSADLYKHREGMTQAEADGLFRKDLAGAEAAVNSQVKVPLTQSQFDALVSLVYLYQFGTPETDRF